MDKTFIDYELANETVGQTRILAADKIGMEHTCRVNNWPVADGPRAVTLMLFYALKRQSRIASTNFDAFLDSELIDWAIADDPTETEPENPTQ